MSNAIDHPHLCVCVILSVCLYVCVFVCKRKPKWLKLKPQAKVQVHRYHKVQKHTEGDQVAGMSLHLH